MSNVEHHKNICKDLNDLYKRKNADYGDSFSRQFAEYGITSSVIRIEDKFLRLKQLSKNEALVEDETIEDTLVDLANYAIMTVMELQKSKLTGGSIGHENQVEPFFEAL